MAAFAAWPLAVRIALIAVVGLACGAAVNWATYSLAYLSRPWSPWSRRHPRDGRGRLRELLPIVGWWAVRHRADRPEFARGFWIRPLIVELVFGFGFPAWYWWEAVAGGLLVPRVAPAQLAGNTALSALLHAACLVHLTLFAVMLAASLIDADEWNIPDEVTIPSTLVGLALATWLPYAQLPAFFNPQFQQTPVLLDAAEPFAWPQWFEAGRWSSLVLALGCLGGWCGGLVVGGRFPRLRTSRTRWRTAWAVFGRRIRRDAWTPRVVVIGTAAAGTVCAMWKLAPAAHWNSMLSALLGLAGGGAIVWCVRILGGWAFQKEAMGFGDVTLMAMIGTYIGWQPTLLAFFAAPIAALVIYIPAMLIRKHEALPYGPYLCASTAGVLLFWSDIWSWAEPRFTVAWLVPVVLLGGFLILGLIMSLVRKLRHADETA